MSQTTTLSRIEKKQHTVLGPIYAISRDPFKKLWTKCKKPLRNKTNKEACVYFLTAPGDEETEVIVAVKSSKSKHKKNKRRRRRNDNQSTQDTLLHHYSISCLKREILQ